MVSDKKIFKVFYIDYIGKISPAPWRPCFLTNPNGLNSLGRGSPKEHFCKNICKSVHWFLTRRFFKFLVKKSIFSSCDLDMQWTGTIWTTLKEDQPRIIPAKFRQIPISGLGRRTVSDHNTSTWAFDSGKLKKCSPSRSPTKHGKGQKRAILYYLCVAFFFFFFFFKFRRKYPISSRGL